MAGDVRAILAAEIAESSARRAELTAVAQAFFSSFDEHDVEARVSLFAEAFVFEDPAGTVRATDRDGLRAFYEGMATQRYELRFTQRGLVACGGSALVDATVRVAIGDLGSSEIDLAILVDVDAAGRIVHLRTFFDEGHIRP